MHGRGTRVRVLIAEDEPVARRLLDSMVQQWGYESVVCTDGAQAWEALQHASAPRLAVVDWMMPECSGPELCCKLRRQEREAYVYIILLTSRGDTNDVVAGLDAGADDYLRKPFDRHELRVRLRAGRRIIELQDELIATQNALRDQATHDSLTGLWNRRAILEMLQAEMARAERQEEPLSVLIADIDRFKAINDTRGHMVGDVVLREVATRLARAVRPYDGVGRYGGEEFLCVLPHSRVDAAASAAERVRAAVAAQPVAVPDGEVHVTVSVGAAAAMDPRAAPGLLQAADEALYRAKDAGRDRVEAAAVKPQGRGSAALFKASGLLR